MADLTMSIKTPLPAETLLFNTLEVTEELGRLPQYNISVLSDKNNIDPDKLLGKHVTVAMVMSNGRKRFFDCHAVRFAYAGKRGKYFRYQITGRPWLWFLTRTSDCRIFQAKTSREIIKEIFGKYGNAAVDDKLTGTYRKREYCVQYRETDFNFVSRLMEEDGIYYYFKHTDGKHQMVLADSPSGHAAGADFPSLPYVESRATVREDRDHVSAWTYQREIQPGAYVLEDYNFKTPSVDLLVKRVESRSTSESGHEYYDYPGDYIDAGEGKPLVQVRLEELQARYELAQGQTSCRGLRTGDVFELTQHPRADQNRKYVIVAAQHQLEYSDYESLGSQPVRYNCAFTVLSNKEQFRTQRATPKPAVQGVQPAIVVGPAGDEIYTDEYGRVKVQFYWDRLGKKDANSSCWVRVSHPWAGKNYGMIAIPRIGQEVVVDFVEGDPDRPLITGRVYNAEQMPPWALPANMTQTGTLTRSSKGGSAANANALRFEDKKGAEQIWIHAEKNQDIEVENDETHWVGHDRTKTIDHDETSHIKHDRTETVDHDETITVHNNRTEKVDQNEVISIGVNRTEKVGANEQITIGANRSVSVGSNETKTVNLARSHTVGLAETIHVGAAQAITIGAAQAVTIGATQSIKVAGTQSTQVGGDQTNKVGGNRTIGVGGDQSVKVGGNHAVEVSGDDGNKVSGKQSVDVGGDYSLKGGGKGTIEIADELTITCGQASIVLKKNGDIKISGMKIEISATQDLKVSGMNVTSEAQVKSLTSGTMVNVEASGIGTIKGALVKIN